MGELDKNQNLKTITLKEMFSDDQLHELLRCVSAGSFGDWSHLKNFLKLCFVIDSVQTATKDYPKKHEPLKPVIQFVL